jgi:hypothetical protein
MLAPSGNLLILQSVRDARLLQGAVLPRDG